MLVLEKSSHALSEKRMLSSCMLGIEIDSFSRARMLLEMFSFHSQNTMRAETGAWFIIIGLAGYYLWCSF